MSRLPQRLLGFYVVTMIPVTLAHLDGVGPGLLAGELVDSLVTTALFTGIFAAGSLLGSPSSAAGGGRQLVTGAAAGVVLWGLLWLGWSASAALKPWALVVNCSAIFAAGCVSSSLPPRRAVADA